jgi:broad specificity phosphatase PhoE
MEKHVYFVRHGESDSNADGIARGQAAMLSEKGKEQARIVAKRIHKIGVDALVSSPYARTLDTAKAIAQEIGLPIEQSDFFTERRRPSGIIGSSWMTNTETRSILHQVFDGYKDETHRHSDEENFSDLRERANAALNFLANHPKDRICVVTHGIFLRVLLAAVLNGPDFSGLDMQNAIRSVEMDNTAVSHLVLREDHHASVPQQRWVIKNWNDSAHLG